MKKLSKKELEELGAHYDSIAGTEAEKAEWGKGYTLKELGAKNGMDAGKKLLAMQKTYSFRLPVVLVAGLKRKAKAEQKPYQRIVNDALWAAVR